MKIINNFGKTSYWTTFIMENNRYKHLFETMNDINVSDIDSVTPTIKEWDEPRFEKEFVHPIRVKDRYATGRENFCRVFMSCYLGGQDNPDICSAIVGILLNMKTRNNVYIMTDLLLDDNGLSLSVDTLTPGDIKYEPSVPDDPKLEVPKDDAQEWYNKYDAMIKKGNEDLDYVVNLLGSIILTLMRVNAKDPPTVVSQIIRNVGRKFADFWGKTSTPVVLGPHKEFMKMMDMSFKRLQPNGNRVMAMIVYSLGHCNADKNLIEGILKSNCLICLTGVGLGCVMWTIKASNTTGIKVVKLMKYMAIDMYVEAVDAVYQTLNYHHKAGRYSWKYCRLFDGSALNHISVRSYPKYAAVMVAINCNANPADPIWDSTQLNLPQISVFKPAAIDLGRRIIRALNSVKNSVAYTEEAKKLIVDIERDSSTHVEHENKDEVTFFNWNEE